MTPAEAPRGLLHVELDYPAGAGEELHDWYNGEHLPERLSVPGFVSARRFGALEAGPRWLALYELVDPAVLETPAYVHWLGPGETPWSRRVLARNEQFRRTVAELVWRAPGWAPADRPMLGPPGLFQLRLSAPPAGPPPAVLLDCPGLIDAALYRDLSAPPGALLLCALADVWAVQEPEFRRRWSDLAASLTDASITYRRGLYVRLR